MSSQLKSTLSHNDRYFANLEQLRRHEQLQSQAQEAGENSKHDFIVRKTLRGRYFVLIVAPERSAGILNRLSYVVSKIKTTAFQFFHIDRTLAQKPDQFTALTNEINERIPQIINEVPLFNYLKNYIAPEIPQLTNENAELRHQITQLNEQVAENQLHRIGVENQLRLARLKIESHKTKKNSKESKKNKANPSESKLEVIEHKIEKLEEKIEEKINPKKSKKNEKPAEDNIDTHHHNSKLGKLGDTLHLIKSKSKSDL